jgi:hypothetical protein
MKVISFAGTPGEVYHSITEFTAQGRLEFKSIQVQLIASHPFETRQSEISTPTKVAPILAVITYEGF